MPILRADLEWSPTAPATARHTMAAWLAGAADDEVAAGTVRLEVTASTMFDPPVPSCALGEAIVGSLCDDWGVDGSGPSTRAWAAISA